jgi:excisionase family DNA binding protein
VGQKPDKGQILVISLTDPRSVVAHCVNCRGQLVGPRRCTGTTVAPMPERRFLTREQVAEELNISMSQTYALIRRGEIRAAKIGGRGDWRIGRDELESFIQGAYGETARWIQAHPFAEYDG